VAARFLAALRRALPGLPREEVCWRLFFAIGSMAFTMGAREQLQLISQGRADATDPEAALRRLVAFAAGGLRAAVKPQPKRRRR